MDASLGSVKGISGLPPVPPVPPAVHVPAHAAESTPRGLLPATGEEAKKAELQGKPIPMSEEQWIRAVEKALKQAQGPVTYLDFSVHKPTKEVMVRVINQETGEVIREIPPEKHLDLVANLMKMAGILVDKRI